MNYKQLELSTVYHLAKIGIDKSYLAKRIKAVVPATIMVDFISKLECSDEDKEFYLTYTWEYEGEEDNESEAN